MMVMTAFGYGIQFHNSDLSYNMALWTNDINSAGICNISFDFRKLQDRYGLNETEKDYYEDIYITSNVLMSRLVLFAFLGAGEFMFGLTGMFFMSLQFIEKIPYKIKNKKRKQTS